MSSESIFNNRGVAIGVWLALLLVYAVSRRDRRQHLRAVIDAFSQRQILIPYGLMLAYVALMVWGLKSVGLWEVRQFKDTAVWLLVIAAGSFFRLPPSADDPIYFRNVLKENLRLIVIVEFIVAFFPGSLLFELALVPFGTFLGLIIVFAERDRKHAKVASLLNWLATLLGASLLLFALHQVVTNVLGFATLETLADFTLPPLLTVLFLPFIFLATVYTNYERDFRLVDLTLKDLRLRTQAKRKALLNFHWRTSLLARWRRDLSLQSYRTVGDIDRSIRFVLARRARERNPPIVPKSEGWSPYQAKEFLVNRNN